MFRFIFEREVLNQIRLHKFLVSTTVTLALTLLCLGVSSERYLYKTKEYTSAIQHQRDILTRTKSMTEASLGNGVFETVDHAVFRKPNPLFVLCNGKDDSLGDIARLSSRSMPLYLESYSSLNQVSNFDLGNTLSDMVNSLDFRNIVKFLFSLIAVFIGFDIVSSEREQGTLKLIMANSVARQTFVFAKWSAGLAVMAAALIFALIFALLYLYTFLHIGLDAEHGARIMALFGFSLLYMLIFYQLAFLASSIAKSSNMAMVALVIFWVMTTFILPNSVTMLGKYFTPTPPIDYIRMEEDAISKKYSAAMTNSREDNTKILEVRENIQRDIGRAQQHYINSLRKQYSAAVAWSLLSPASIFDNAAEIVSGTSISDYDQFMERVRVTNESYASLIKNWKFENRLFEYRKQFNITVNELITDASLDNNRLGLGKSIEKASSYIILLIIINVLLFCTILTLDIRVHLT